MIVGGVGLEVVDEIRSAASAAAAAEADCSLHDLLTDAVTSTVNSLHRSVGS